GALFFSQLLCFGSKPESELSAAFANAAVEAQKLETGNRRARGQSRCEVYCIQGPNGLCRKRMACSLDDLWADSQYVPMPSRVTQRCAPVASSAFVDLTDGEGPNQHPLALKYRQLGRGDKLRAAQNLAHTIAGIFAQQPRDDSARLSIDVHRPPRSWSSSRDDFSCFRAGGSFGYTTGSLAVPRTSKP